MEFSEFSDTIKKRILRHYKKGLNTSFAVGYVVLHTINSAVCQHIKKREPKKEPIFKHLVYCALRLIWGKYTTFPEYPSKPR